jgi:RNA polymerase sigma-70 factor (ECF subfamily)
LAAPDHKPSAPSAGDTSRLTEHLFRHESTKLVAVLTRMFGFERLQLAEDVVQEALVRAMQSWPYYGVPENPAAWLTQTAKNLALDILRREQNFKSKEPGIVAVMDPLASGAQQDNGVVFDTEVADDRLRMMFTCCHPVIPEDARVALALKTLCGFGTQEIASAFLSTEAAIAKRLTRAKQKIRESEVPYEIPHGEELSARLDSVEQTLYLLFNEGYKASSGDSLIRAELCHEAIRLAELLVEHPAGNRPRTQALAALMWLNAARLGEREDEDGQILLLAHQVRAKWDRTMIAKGFYRIGLASAGDEITPYHVQAGIAACHCAAPDFESTNWTQILALYDRWIAMDPSPVIALNRAVVVANLSGPAAGLKAIAAIPNRDVLDSYYLLHSVLGDFEARLGNHAAAAGHFQRALGLTAIASEQAFLARRLEECGAGAWGN